MGTQVDLVLCVLYTDIDFCVRQHLNVLPCCLSLYHAKAYTSTKVSVIAFNVDNSSLCKKGRLTKCQFRSKSIM
ncbi:hypothetical protein L6452_43815 [Arctium lappa]|uniref:Uncharacterized protein n=1 Tax=Arctium lappa TaxID=4217 RepID=A0ACB8XE24_ARCLA|nr:hypothetical protein L6452_43815 [Arctium lappa]